MKTIAILFFISIIVNAYQYLAYRRLHRRYEALFLSNLAVRNLANSIAKENNLRKS